MVCGNSLAKLKAWRHVQLFLAKHDQVKRVTSKFSKKQIRGLQQVIKRQTVNRQHEIGKARALASEEYFKFPESTASASGRPRDRLSLEFRI